MAGRNVFELEATHEPNGNGAGIPEGRTLQRMQSKYATAITVQQPRVMSVIEKRVMDEARIAGESFYYGWGAGKDRIEGASQELAFTVARCWGNCAVECNDVQETDDAWVYTASFVDLETGFTLSRPFRQSKASVVHGKHDPERKDEMRFSIGATKASRNVILKALPQWLVDKALDTAKQGVRTKIDAYVKSNGLPAAQNILVRELAKLAVKEQHILDKMGRSAIAGLTVEDLVILKGDLAALQAGAERAEALFPTMATEKKTVSMDELVGHQRESEPAQPAEPEQKDDPGAILDDQTPQVQQPETPQPEPKRGPGRPKAAAKPSDPADLKGPQSPAWDRFNEFLAKMPDEQIKVIRVNAGVPFTPVNEMRTPQLEDLTQRFMDYLAEREVAEADAEFKK